MIAEEQRPKQERGREMAELGSQHREARRLEREALLTEMEPE